MLRTSFALAALLLAAAPALAQIPHADALDHPPTSSATDAPSEGIHVNGVWMLTVRNADGSVASRDTVHNALVPSGQSALVDMLAGETDRPAWVVGLWEADQSPNASELPGSFRSPIFGNYRQ